MAQVDGKPVATLYRPQSAAQQPYTFKSPVSSVTFDYVAPLKEAKVVLRSEKGGYVAEIAVPWSALGYTAQPGRAIPFDVQVIFSDADRGAEHLLRLVAQRQRRRPRQ